MGRDTIRIALAADHAYAAYMETSIISVLKHNAGEEIMFDILDVGLQKNDIKCIQKSIEENGGNCIFHDLNDIRDKLGNVPLWLGSLGTYARLFLPQILYDVEKVLYLDSDTLTVGNIRDLWETDIEDFYLAGVKDVVCQTHRHEIGISDDEIYINAGVILINLKRWREDDISRQIIYYIQQYSDENSFPDQDAINVVCRGEILVLSPRYNVMSPNFLMLYENIIKFCNVVGYYTREQISEAKKNPVIIHFTGYPDSRPWEKRCTHPKRRLYRKYAKMSLIGVEILDRAISMGHRRMLLIYRYMPYPIYYRIRKIKHILLRR